MFFAGLAANIAADGTQIRLEPVFPLGTRAPSTMFSGWWLRSRWAERDWYRLNNIISAKRGGGSLFPQYRGVSSGGLEFMLVPLLIDAGPLFPQYRGVS